MAITTKVLYSWRTDAGSGQIEAASAKDVLAALRADDWWIDGAERDGGWLAIWRADGSIEDAEITKGEMP